MKIAIGTKSKLKIAVLEKVFREIFPEKTFEIFAIDAASGVADAPWGEETLRGAKNRVKFCEKAVEADFYIGIESGLVERFGEKFEEAWAAVKFREKIAIGYSSGLLIPNFITNLMREKNLKHNEAMKKVEDFIRENDGKNDTWEIYSGGKISREISIEEALRNALIQFAPAKNNLYLAKNFDDLEI